MPITRKVMSVSRGRVFTGALSNAGTYPLPSYPEGSAVSPDSKQIYCKCAGGIQILQRNVSTGALTTGTFVSILTASEWCCVSPDGKHVYVCLSTNGNIRLYTRNLSTGELTEVNDYPMQQSSMRKVEISPDGNSVHSFKTNQLRVLQRNSTTGALTYTYLYTTSNDTFRGLFSPDGLYYYNFGPYKEIYVYSRIPATGQLTLVTSYNSGTANPAPNNDPRDACMTNDGLNIYVIGNYNVTQYSRNSTTGLMTNIADVAIPTTGYVQGGGRGCISSDNKHIYVGCVNTGYITRFDRNTSTGSLTYNSSLYLGSSTYYPLIIFTTPDGSNVYVENGNGLSSLNTLTRS